MYISGNRIYRIFIIILTSLFLFSFFSGCSNTKSKVSPAPTLSVSSSPVISPFPATAPIQTEPGNIPLPSSTVDMIHVKGLSIDKETVELSVGQNAALTVSIDPDTSTKKTIIWTSGNEAVVSVSKTTGTTVTLTANAPGTALIKAASEDSGKLAACIVTVKTESVEVSSIALSPTETTLTLGATSKIAANITPINATNKTLIWSSSAPNVAMASDDGTITALGLGNAFISVKSANGKTAICTVHVIEAITGLSVTPTAQSMKIGNTINLSVTVTPQNAQKTKLVWSSSNQAVASVADGVVIAKGVGESVITVKTEDGKYSAYCTVYVSR